MAFDGCAAAVGHYPVAATAMFTATKLSATPSANLRGINFIDIPVVTAEELQAAQAIQDLKAASLANSTPKSTKSKECSIKYGGNLNDSLSPIILASDLIPMSPNNATAETPRAKRKLHMPCHVSQNVTILSKDSECAFKTPQNNGSRRRRASEMFKLNSTLDESPKSSRPKFTCLSPSMTRYDTSLCVLTQRFIDHMNSSIDGIVNLNEAAIILQVPKRRIYDITNVLEGIDLIEKCGKNSCRFRNLDSGQYDTPGERNSKREISALHNAEKTLDFLLNSVQRELNGNVLDKKLSYVKTDDLNSIDDFVGKNLIAIRATADSIIEVPDPVEFDFKSYQMFVSTQKGQLEVSVCQMKNRPQSYPIKDEYARDTTCGMSSVALSAEAAKIDGEQIEYAREVVCTSNAADEKSPVLYYEKNIETISAVDRQSSKIATKLYDEQNSTLLTQNHQLLVALDAEFPSCGATTLNQEFNFLPCSSNGLLDHQNNIYDLESFSQQNDDYLFALEPHEGVVDLFGFEQYLVEGDRSRIFSSTMTSKANFRANPMIIDQTNANSPFR